MRNLGQHLTIDFDRCEKDKLSNLDLCFSILNELPKLISMTPLTQPYVFPYKAFLKEDDGITGFVIIAESHISIHTYPELGKVYMDVFSCKEFDEEIVIEYLDNKFKPFKKNIQKVNRGFK